MAPKSMTWHGILNEASDLRIHVCFKVGQVYVFKIKDARHLIKRNCYKLAVARAEGADEDTARGFIVPIEDLNVIPEDIPMWMIPKHIPERMSEKDKGVLAETIVCKMLEEGLLRIPLEAKRVTDKDAQILGIDIILDKPVKIEVKCDMRGGPKQFGGTGNLFLQVAERNPNRQY